MRRGALTTAVAVAAIAAAVAMPAASGAGTEAKRATKTVTLYDDYFSTDAVSIKKKSKVNWVWAPTNTDTHNVVLTGTHPKGVSKGDFRSSSGAVALQFKRKFTVPGKYGFICTYHKSVMSMTVTVKK